MGEREGRGGKFSPEKGEEKYRFIFPEGKKVYRRIVKEIV